MQFETTFKFGIKIIGIIVKSSKIKENGMLQSYMLWGEYFGKNWPEKIPNKVNPHLHYGIFMDYEHGANAPEGNFTLVVGTEVESLDVIPEGMVGITIPESRYAVFSLKGNMSEEIKKAWKYIWAQWPKDSGIDRSYVADIEVLDSGRFYNAGESEMEIYISVR